MPISAQVYVKHPDLALSHTIRSLPDVEIGVVSDAGTDPQNDVYFFWIEAPDFDAVDDALSEDPTVRTFTPIIENESRRMYRIEYSSDATLISPEITEVGAVIVEARSHMRGWLLELRLQDHDGLYELNEYAKEAGIELDVFELQQTDTMGDRPDIGLTEAQRETLVAAFLQGYYDEPRDADLEDLAELLDVSSTAVSGRLRRGSAHIIEEVLIDGDSD